MAPGVNNLLYVSLPNNDTNIGTKDASLAASENDTRGIPTREFKAFLSH